MLACGLLMASGCFADDPKWGLGFLRQFCKGRRGSWTPGQGGGQIKSHWGREGASGVGRQGSQLGGSWIRPCGPLLQGVKAAQAPSSRAEITFWELSRAPGGSFSSPFVRCGWPIKICRNSVLDWGIPAGWGCREGSRREPLPGQQSPPSSRHHL